MLANALLSREIILRTHERRINVININGVQCLYRGGEGPYKYIYYIDPHTNDIYLEYHVLSASFVYHYTVREDKGVWLVEETKINSITNKKIGAPDTDFAGTNKKSATEYMIQKILKRPRRHDNAGINVLHLEEILRSTLKVN